VKLGSYEISGFEVTKLFQLQRDLLVDLGGQVDVTAAPFAGLRANAALTFGSTSSTATHTVRVSTLASTELLMVFSAIKVPLYASTFLAASKITGTGPFVAAFNGIFWKMEHPARASIHHAPRNPKGPSTNHPRLREPVLFIFMAVNASYGDATRQA
jgi:hypothetical protein